MPLPQDQTYTINDIYTLPDGERAELINGRIYYMAPPSTKHQRILSFLHLNVADFIRKNNGSCEVFPAPFAVFLNKDDTTYVEPDISVICDSDKINDKGCNGAPDWIIEIVSPGSQSHDYVRKLNLYMASGVREYWIVDPSTQAVTVYQFESSVFAQHYTFTDTIKVGIYNDLYIDFSQLNI